MIGFFRYEYEGQFLFFNIYQLIKNLKIFILGPFPFYQVFADIIGYEWQIQNYPLVIYNWVIFFVVIKNIRTILNTNLKILFYISMGFISSLILFGQHMHIDYMVVGIVFLLPIIATFNYPYKYLTVYSMIIYLMLNLSYFIVSMIATGSPFMGIFS